MSYIVDWLYWLYWWTADAAGPLSGYCRVIAGPVSGYCPVTAAASADGRYYRPPDMSVDTKVESMIPEDLY